MWMCAEYFFFFCKFSVYLYIFQYNGPLYSIIFHHVSIVHVCILNIVTTVRKPIFAKIVYSMLFCCVFHSGCYLFLCVSHFSFLCRSFPLRPYILALFIYIVSFGSRLLYWDCIRTPHCIFSVIIWIAGRRCRHLCVCL